MLVRLAAGGAILAITPSIFKLFDATDNPTYYNAPEAAELAVEGVIEALALSADGACLVEVGLTNTGKSSFTPIYPVRFGTNTVPFIKRFVGSRPDIDFSAATIKLLAVRVTVASDATVNVAGDVEVQKRF